MWIRWRIHRKTSDVIFVWIADGVFIWCDFCVCEWPRQNCWWLHLVELHLLPRRMRMAKWWPSRQQRGRFRFAGRELLCRVLLTLLTGSCSNRPVCQIWTRLGIDGWMGWRWVFWKEESIDGFVWPCRSFRSISTLFVPSWTGFQIICWIKGIWPYMLCKRAPSAARIAGPNASEACYSRWSEKLHQWSLMEYLNWRSCESRKGSHGDDASTSLDRIFSHKNEASQSSGSTYRYLTCIHYNEGIYRHSDRHI